MQWYRNAIDFAGELEVDAMGGPAGALSPDEALTPNLVDAPGGFFRSNLSIRMDKRSGDGQHEANRCRSETGLCSLKPPARL